MHRLPRLCARFVPESAKRRADARIRPRERRDFPGRRGRDRFRLPACFGSLVAVPQQPGWSDTSIYSTTPSVSAGPAVSLSREYQIGNIPVSVSAHISANLSGTGDLGLFIPSYVFATPVLGGQAAASLMGIYGNTRDSLTGNSDGQIGSIPFGPRFDKMSGSATGIGDLYPLFTLRWKERRQQLHDLRDRRTSPVGDYNSASLANIGIGHGAVDFGGGYTYFDPQSGHELSAVLGFTYNLLNPSTQYQNGVDMHLDWAASQFLTKQIMIGLVGYVYDELSCDSGSGDPRRLSSSSACLASARRSDSCSRSDRCRAVLNLKAYGEFDAANCPFGWDAWVTLVISPATSAAARPPLITK